MGIDSGKGGILRQGILAITFDDCGRGIDRGIVICLLTTCNANPTYEGGALSS